MTHGAEDIIPWIASFNNIVIIVTFVLVVILMVVQKWAEKSVLVAAGLFLLLLFRIVTLEGLIPYVEGTVICLLGGMMWIVGMGKDSNIFDWIGIKIVKLVNGNPVLLMMMFAITTAVFSAFLDNVTMVIIITPIVMQVARTLMITFKSFLLPVTFASNIGGTATSVGDPPNIIISSKTEMGFGDFVHFLTPVVVVIQFVELLIEWFVFRRELVTTEERKKLILEKEKSVELDMPLLWQFLFILSSVITGFALHTTLDLNPGVIAFSGGIVFTLIRTPGDPHRVYHELTELKVIAFFIFLFMFVGAVVSTGVLTYCADQLFALSGFMTDKMFGLTGSDYFLATADHFSRGHLFLIVTLVLWFSAIGSAVIDNIPFTATMIPLIIAMAVNIWPEFAGMDQKAIAMHADLRPIWWALALGACLGGNATPIGASANVIVLAEMKKAEQEVSNWEFVKQGVPRMLIQTSISNVYLWLMYF